MGSPSARWIPLAASFALGACLVDGGSFSGVSAVDSPAASVTTGIGATAPGAGTGAGTETVPPASGSSFAAVPTPVAVLRVKNLLTGLVPSQAEVDAATADPNALGTLVDAWTATAEYQAKMEVFWADAFQQSQAQADDFHLSLDDHWFTPSDQLLLNYRQSFAKTVTQLVKEGAPFNQVATTNRYMLTTAMMMYLAYVDTVMLGDSPAPGQDGPSENRFLQINQNFNYQLVHSSGPISIADSANPQSQNFMKFYLPIMNQYLDASTQAHCASYDPIVMTAGTSFANAGGLTMWLYSALIGDEYRFFEPPQGNPAAVFCQGSPGSQQLQASDYTDWRMVTLAAPANNAGQSKFYDMANLRRTTALNIFQPRLGYFTTPAFFSQWNTNISNQARVTANQTLIVGLGRAIDGSLAVPLTNPPGLNATHAADPACMGCHITLDPMRQFFRQAYSLTFSSQLDTTQQSMPGTFGYDGVTGSGSLADLGRLIGTHPRFKLAWTQKLCNWANSTICDPTDPELIRIAGVFAASNYSWPALVREMFTSPLITFAAPTQTAVKMGVTAPIARRAHLCAALDNRLGLTDSCGLMQINNGLNGSAIANSAYALPRDQYSRGAVNPVYVSNPDLFYRNIAENVCSLVADQVVDSGGSAKFTSSARDTAVASIVHDFLGLDTSRDTPVISALKDHYSSVTASGASATTALKSTFVLACISPYMTSVGQ